MKGAVVKKLALFLALALAAPAAAFELGSGISLENDLALYSLHPIESTLLDRTAGDRAFAGWYRGTLDLDRLTAAVEYDRFFTSDLAPRQGRFVGTVEFNFLRTDVATFSARYQYDDEVDRIADHRVGLGVRF